MKFLVSKSNILAIIVLVIVLIGFVAVDKSQVRGESHVNKACADCGDETIVENVLAKSFTPERIVMEKAGIDLPVVSVPMTNGTWEVNPGVANFAAETSVVNESTGNVGIYGHARDDAFLKIKLLSPGDSVVVYGKNYRALYIVEISDKISPSSVEAFFPENSPVLTLITCDGVFDQYRYRVKAKLIEITEI